MQSLLNGLPADVAQRIHPDWKKNETDYWARRADLLTRYRDQWVGFANGEVIVAGPSPVEVLHAAQKSGLHPFVACVGREDEPSQMRRTSFSYDLSYTNEALPVVEVEFRTRPASPGVLVDRVIADTGADASALPWSDCQRLHLDPEHGIPGLIGGVGTTTMPTIVFAVWAWIDGKEYRCRLQAEFVGHERIFGRDVLNRADVLFRGPSQEIVFNP